MAERGLSKRTRGREVSEQNVRRHQQAEVISEERALNRPSYRRHADRLRAGFDVISNQDYSGRDGRPPPPPRARPPVAVWDRVASQATNIALAGSGQDSEVEAPAVAAGAGKVVKGSDAQGEGDGRAYGGTGRAEISTTDDDSRDRGDDEGRGSGSGRCRDHGGSVDVGDRGRRNDGRSVNGEDGRDSKGQQTNGHTRREGNTTAMMTREHIVPPLDLSMPGSQDDQ